MVHGHAGHEFADVKRIFRFLRRHTVFEGCAGSLILRRIIIWLSAPISENQQASSAGSFAKPCSSTDKALRCVAGRTVDDRHVVLVLHFLPPERGRDRAWN